MPFIKQSLGDKVMAAHKITPGRDLAKNMKNINNHAKLHVSEEFFNKTFDIKQNG